MEDNDINKLLERNGTQQRVPFLRSSRERDVFPDDRSETSSKHRYSGGRKSIKKTSTYESILTSRSGYNLRGVSSRSNRGHSESPSVDAEQRRTQRSEQMQTRQRVVVNGASVHTVADGDEVTKRHSRRELSKSVNTSDYSSDEGKGLETLRGTAYPLYKQAGDWWDVFPKTDYTYSPASPDRKEIVPGVIPMPNMSRRSIHSDSSSSEYSAMRFSVSNSSSKSLVDSQTSWFGNKSSGSVIRRKRNFVDADSDVDEVDVHYSERSASQNSYYSMTRICMSIWTFLTHIATTVSKTVHRILHDDESRHAHKNSSRVSWFQKLNVLHYWTVCNALLLDFWLLKFFSRRNEIAPEENERQSRVKYFLLLLIPPLILAAWWWFASHNVPHEDTVMPLVEITPSNMKKIWWLPFSLSNFWGSEKIVVSPGKEKSPGNEYAVNLELLVQKIVGNEDFQNLVLSEAVKREQERKEAEQAILSTLQFQKASLEKELNDKNEMLSRQLELHAKLAEDMALMKQQVENLEIQLQSVRDFRKDPAIDSSQGLWRREIRRLEDRIRLLEVSHSKRPCCKVTPPPLPTLAIEEHVMKFLSGLFNSDVEAESKIPGIQTWLERLFVAKEDLESKLANISSSLNLEVGEASRHSAQAIMSMVSDQIRHEYVKQQAELAAKLSEQKRNWVLPVATLSDNCSLTVSQVQDIVNNALNTYDADKTGMVDYALESSGGSIINTRCTDTYNARTATLSLLGVPLWWPSSNPRTVIQPGVNPGECWAFRGAQGYLVIRLSGRVKISAFSIEHIPVSLAPNGRIDSAPKDFSVWGLKNENDKDPELLGRYTYRDNATSLQSFRVQRADLPPFEIVELRIESNHGNLEYTCLYRFRVHGVLSKE
ncbi:klaroid protein isoform X2 [Anabrus simplex]|uniref:klaroid protein isoform X2 n=1 Tax=Anabrus simplex TaxID=316456 RepID=UPI0035A271ED